MLKFEKNFYLAKLSSDHITLGFTLIELLVVVAIMVILTTVMVINLNGQRASRDIKIAENELVSNLRQIQSYTLSGRAEPSGQPVQFYIMKFDLTQPTKYTIQALFNADSSPQYLENIETINLPANIRLAAVNGVQINRANSPTSQSPSQTGMNCALAAFAAPFAKVFLNDGCALADTVNKPAQISTGDDYAKILPSNFVSSITCISYPSPSSPPYSPASCTVSTDSTMVITLTDAANTISKIVTINGITGVITFN
jgi:prepilin-type N-terminal cleavage/methylation domain-containing protein